MCHCEFQSAPSLRHHELACHAEHFNPFFMPVHSDDEAPWLICNIRLLAQDGTSADMLVPSHSIQSSAASSGESEGHPSFQGSAARRASPATAAAAAGSNVRTSTEEVRVASGTNSPGAVRMLYGSLVANAQMLYTPEGNHRPHFIFPEVCIRSQGYFQLQANLMRLPSAGGSTTGALATATTSAFAVHLSRNYSAPREWSMILNLQAVRS